MQPSSGGRRVSGELHSKAPGGAEPPRWLLVSTISALQPKHKSPPSASLLPASSFHLPDGGLFSARMGPEGAGPETTPPTRMEPLGAVEVEWTGHAGPRSMGTAWARAAGGSPLSMLRLLSRTINRSPPSTSTDPPTHSHPHRMTAVLPFEFGTHTGRRETQAIMESWLSEPSGVAQLRVTRGKPNPLAAVGQHMSTF